MCKITKKNRHSQIFFLRHTFYPIPPHHFPTPFNSLPTLFLLLLYSFFYSLKINIH